MRPTGAERRHLEPQHIKHLAECAVHHVLSAVVLGPAAPVQ
jgi:hypothetical protein